MHTYEIDDYKIRVYESYTSLRCVSMRYICLQGRHACEIRTYDAHVYKVHLSYWHTGVLTFLMSVPIFFMGVFTDVYLRRASLPGVHLSQACISVRGGPYRSPIRPKD